MTETFKAKSVVETNEAYHKNESISASRINEILRSPLHFKCRYIDGVEEKKTPALEFGTLAHTALLEPKVFLENFVIEPKFSGTGSKKAYEDWQNGLKPGTIVMSQKEADAIVGMIKGIQAHPIAKKLLKGGIAEHSYYFIDPITKLPCKFRPDYLTEDGYIVNLKTTTDASRGAFSASVARYGYHVAAAFYSLGFKEVFGQEPKGYIFIPIEKTPPYAAAVYVADATVMETGEKEMRKGLDLIKRCYDQNSWPSYQSEGAENISMPMWALNLYE